MATFGTKNVHSDIVSHEKEDEEDEVEKKTFQNSSSP